MVRRRILLGLALFVTAPLLAQEWSAEQKEAWAFELAYWKALSDGDVATTTSSMHDDYRGWSYAQSVPGTKESARNALSHFASGTKTFLHHPTPLAILVRGNLAVVHYVVSFHGTNEKGEHETSEDRWTDTLIKENGKWLLLADHGGNQAAFK